MHRQISCLVEEFLLNDKVKSSNFHINSILFYIYYYNRTKILQQYCKILYKVKRALNFYLKSNFIYEHEPYSLHIFIQHHTHIYVYLKIEYKKKKKKSHTHTHIYIFLFNRNMYINILERETIYEIELKRS